MRAALCLALALLALPAQAQAPARFSFAIVGDAPYNALEEPAFAQELKEIDREDLAFVVHIGDIKSGGSPCSDALFARRLQQFQSVRHPFIYVPGDNEWTDCWHSGADPLERLAKLRAMFYPDDNSLGERKLRLERQSADPRFAEYRENVRWSVGPALFIGLNLPGSNNNFGRTPQMDEEYARRGRANAAWLAQGFELAKKNGAAAVFIAIQADPFFERASRRPADVADGYAQFKQELLAHTLDFGKPVILIHGDTHRYRVDHPLLDPATHKPLRNFTRIESFGSPFVDWIKVSVDPASAQLLSIRTGTAIRSAP
ncbi:MAG: hypothetical protein ACYC7B_03090 [Burkholderiales bacterium]